MKDLLQAKNIIEKSRSIIVFPASEAQGDSFGAALALFFTLKKLGKNANLLTDAIPEKFRFLTAPEETPKEFIISVDTGGTDVSKLRYEKDESGLKIYLTPKNGSFDPLRISFPPQEEKVFLETNGKAVAEKDETDLAVVIGASSLNSLGSQLEKNAEVLSRAPILNIDNQLANENFGEVNLVEIASSLSEIIMGLTEMLEPSTELMDKKTATALLAGMVWSSQNFRDPKTRPKTFKAAAALIERGADHQKIIHHLYKQKTISQIKILGRILEKISHNEEKQLCFASLSEQDFSDCQASSKDLSFAIEELKLNFRYLPNLLVLWESHASPVIIKGIIHSPSQKLIKKILENFEGVSRGGSILFLVRENSLRSAQEKILKII